MLRGGEVPAGTPIRVDDLATHFGVSRIPVREALMTLVGEGLVVHRPHAGYAVARLTAAELRELYVVRRLLETAALSSALAAAGPEDDACARAAFAALDAAVERGDQAAYHRESRAFHLALVAPARMHRLRHVLESAWDATELCRPMAHVPEAERRAMHAEHSEMLAAFTARDEHSLLEASGRHHARLETSIAAIAADAAAGHGQA
ncbi:FCD domain-containing protein [Modestobacter sp. I12A-02628]|uniref:GntR family transcriptional regulator n=2 Tax=Goekera deserti TaxID=2497753 RepID=A0A7K3W9S0_9ACTN|nr:FCD domain-containing protein [Goekera deserti]NDI49606.1 FCD domain-containing protein [Goekera deserti]NEL53201.1 GntR family transcriptional regulator [Goekera deserti]